MPNHEVQTTKIEIPLEARLSRINYTRPDIEWVNAKTIATEIGVYDRWVYRTVKELGVESEIKVIDGVDMPAYPHWIVDILREELQWREQVRDLPNELSVREIAENLGRSFGWTQKSLEEIAASPVRKTGPVRYGKRFLKELHQISWAVPLDDGWYNIRQISELTGQDRSWVERRILETGIEPMQRRSALTGRIHDYFPPKIVDAMQNAIVERATAAGEWMTVRGMAQRLGRTEKWVAARVGAYEVVCEMKQDDMGVTRTHYPPVVIADLSAESEHLKQLPERGDYLNIHEVARFAGHETAWAQRLVSLLGIEPELRRDKKGRAQPSYSPSTVQRLIDYQNTQRSQEKGIAPADLWEEQVAVASLRSRIRLKRQLDAALKQHGVSSTDVERQSIAGDIHLLQRELKLAAQRLYRLEAKAGQQKGQLVTNESQLESAPGTLTYPRRQT